MMHRRTLFASALLAAPLALSVAAPARAQRILELLAGTKLGADRFVQLATVGNNFEIESSRILLSRSTHPQIREFAERMVQHHTALGAEFAALPEASTRTPAALDDDATRKLILLRNQTDVDLLNRYYVQQQIEAHEDAVEAYDIYAREGDVPALQQFAQRTLPRLREHLAAARALQAPSPG